MMNIDWKTSRGPGRSHCVLSWLFCIVLGTVLLAYCETAPAGLQSSTVLHAIDLHRRADELYDRGKYRDAENLELEALRIFARELGDADPKTISSYHSLANTYRDSGKYTAAESIYRKILTYQERINGSEHKAVANLLNDFANLYRFEGAYDKAAPLYLRSLAIYNNTPGSKDTGPILTNIGNFHSELGQFTLSESYYKKALDVYAASIGARSIEVAKLLNNLANLYMHTGAFEKAEDFYRQSISIKEQLYGAEHPDTARSFHNLGELYLLMGNYDEAEKYTKRALDLRTRILGPSHPGVGTTLFNLAEISKAVGNVPAATHAYQRSLEIFSTSVDAEHPFVADSLDGFAQLLMQQHQYKEARALFQKALSIRTKKLGFENPGTARTINNLAVLSWTIGDTNEARKLLKQSQDIHAKNRSLFLLSGSEARKLAYLQNSAQQTDQAISFALANPDQASVLLGLQSVLEVKGRALDATATSINNIQRTSDAHTKSLIAALARSAEQLSALTYQGSNNLADEEYRRRVIKLREEQERLQTELSTISSEFGQKIARVNIANIRQKIPEGTALVEYFRYSPFRLPSAPASTNNAPRIVAFVVKATGPISVIDLGEALYIESQVQRFRASLSSTADNGFEDISTKLAECIFAPLRNEMSNIKRVLISADGELNLIPFSALLDSQHKFLNRDFEIGYLTSGRDLIHPGSGARPKSGPILVANPSFGIPYQLANSGMAEKGSLRSEDIDRGGLLFRPLASTSSEADEIKSLLRMDGAELLMGESATESRIKKIESPRLLHIATHGFFLSNQTPTTEARNAASNSFKVAEDPLLRSGLALAGANMRQSGERNDGILTALEAAQLDLRGTELVVLSACDTGVGEVRNGEGVYGLRRAFQLAGAASQVTSLWKVSDDATSLLMIDFYKRLLNGEGRAEALRHAQLDMLTIPKYSHPFYWASFIPIGNWKPLSKLQ